MKLLSRKYLRILSLFMTFSFAATLVASPALARDRHSPRNHYRSHHVRVVGDGSAIPAIIATGILAGITFSLIDSAVSDSAPRCEVAPRPAPAVSTTPRRIDTGSVVVTAMLLNVRSGPSLSEPAIGQVPNGTVLSICGNAPGWYYVKMPGAVSGWVMAQYTAPVGYPANG